MSLDRYSSSQRYIGFCDADALLSNCIMAGKVRIIKNRAHTEYITVREVALQQKKK